MGTTTTTWGGRETTKGPGRHVRVGRAGARALALALLAPWILAGGPSAAQEPPPGNGGARPAAPTPLPDGTLPRPTVPAPPVDIGRVAAPIVVDGVWGEGEWAGTETQEIVYEASPRPNRPAAARTLCRFGHDADHLYFSCRAWDDDPDAIRAFPTARDDIDNHDLVGFILDPAGDARRGFRFWVSAAGVQADALWDEAADDGEDDSWDAIWDAAARRTDDGWIAEAAIPWASLRFPPPRAGHRWRVFFFRLHPRDRRTWYRNFHLDTSNRCTLCQAAEADAPLGISPGRNLELVPTLVADRTDARSPSPSGALEAGPVDPSVGLSGRWGITPDLSLNATVNPDFSQVEADAAQLVANERFALVVDERRPFFLEGVDLFQTPIRAAFTRTIADPVAGAKVSGRVGSDALGLLVARDRATALLLPAPDGSSRERLDQGNTAVLGRWRRDLSPGASAGLLYTGRVGEGYHNHVASADLFLRPLPSMTLQVQGLRSWTRYPEAALPDSTADASPAGNAARVVAGFGTRAWEARMDLYRVDRGTRLDLGFEPAAGFTSFESWVRRNWWGGADDWWTRFDLMVGTYIARTPSALADETMLFGRIGFGGPMQSSVFINPQVSQQTVEGETFDLARLWTFWNVQPSGRTRIHLRYGFGDAVDYLNRRSASMREGRGELTVRLGRRLELFGSYSRRSLSHDGRSALDATVAQGRAVYHFSTRARLRVLGQYSAVDRNPETNPADVDLRTRDALTQALFAYTVNPQTVVYVGYGDARTEDDARPFDEGLLTARRTFFLKLGYAWRP